MDVVQRPSMCCVAGDTTQPPGFLLHSRCPKVPSALCPGTNTCLGQRILWGLGVEEQPGQPAAGNLLWQGGWTR